MLCITNYGTHYIAIGIGARAFAVVMRGTPPVLQIAAENFPQRGVARSKSVELSKDGHRPSTCEMKSVKRLESKRASSHTVNLCGSP